MCSGLCKKRAQWNKTLTLRKLAIDFNTKTRRNNSCGSAVRATQIQPHFHIHANLPMNLPKVEQLATSFINALPSQAGYTSADAPTVSLSILPVLLVLQNSCHQPQKQIDRLAWGKWSGVGGGLNWFRQSIRGILLLRLPMEILA